MFLTMFSHTSCFYILLLTFHIATSTEDNDALLSKVVNNINDGKTENKLQSIQTSFKSSNTLRNYNHMRYKDSIPFLRHNLIKPHYKNKSYVPVALKNINKRQSAFYYAQKRMNNKKYLQHRDGQFEFQCNLRCCSYNKMQLDKNKLQKCYEQCYPSSVILCNIVTETSIKEYDNKTSNKHRISHPNNRNIIQIKNNVKNSNMLCFNTCNNFTSTIIKSISVFQTVYNYSEIFNIIKCYFPEEKLLEMCFQGTTESYLHYVCFRKQYQGPLNYILRKIKVKHKTGISPKILTNFSILHFSRDVKLNKCCIKSVSHYNISAQYNRGIKRIHQIKLKGKILSSEFYRIKRNLKSFQPNISKPQMMKHPYQFLHRIRKRNTENDTTSIFESDKTDINNSTLYPLRSNVSTDGVENLNTSSNISFDISSNIIDPFKRRGEDGVIYIHGLFEMSVGDCRIYPETGWFEYKAAQLAIQHVNEKNVIDGYRLEMYHNDTRVSTLFIFPKKLHKLL